MPALKVKKTNWALYGVGMLMLFDYFSLARVKMFSYSWRDTLNSWLIRLSIDSFTKEIKPFCFALSNTPNVPVNLMSRDSANDLAAISSKRIKSAFNSNAKPIVSLSPAPRSTDNIFVHKVWLIFVVLSHGSLLISIFLSGSEIISFSTALGIRIFL